MNFLSQPEDFDEVERISVLRKLCEDDYFNMAENKYINIYFLYINNGSCEQYKKDVVELRADGLLNRDDFMSEIIKYRVNCGRKYNVIGLYSYRPEFTNNELEEFITDPSKSNCFFSHSKVDTIRFPESIELFQHHNSLFVLLSSEQVKKTKKALEQSSRKTLKNA